MINRNILFCFTIIIGILLPPSKSSNVTTSSPSSNNERIRFCNGKHFVQKKVNVDEHVDGVLAFNFTQVLDHFNPNDNRRWEQRYWIYDRFYKTPHGPVFLLIDGENSSGPTHLIGNFYSQILAEKFGALMFLVEHRYYGNSHPTRDTSTENLKYLSSRQALKDLETFVDAMKRIHNLKHNKWVSFGGSYSGSLSAWFRLKCSGCVHTAFATSAPVHLQLVYEEYYDTVIESLFIKHSQACVDAIHDATIEIQQLVNGGESEWNRLMKQFNICPSFTKTRLNIQNMYADLCNGLTFAVQYNGDNIGPNEIGVHNVNIPDLCAIMTDVKKQRQPFHRPIERYAKLFQFTNVQVLGLDANACNDFSYAGLIKYARQDSWTSDSVTSSFRQWLYQVCTEFGFFQVSTFKKGSDIFGDFPPEYFFQQCQDIFGSKFTKEFVTKSFESTRAYYGGHDGLMNTTRIIFVNGKIDPWHPAGILHSNETSSKNTVIYISDSAHCADGYKEGPKDSVSLKFARELVKSGLEEYLSL